MAGQPSLAEARGPSRINRPCFVRCWGGAHSFSQLVDPLVGRTFVNIVANAHELERLALGQRVLLAVPGARRLERGGGLNWSGRPAYFVAVGSAERTPMA